MKEETLRIAFRGPKDHVAEFCTNNGDETFQLRDYINKDKKHIKAESFGSVLGFGYTYLRRRLKKRDSLWEMLLLSTGSLPDDMPNGRVTLEVSFLRDEDMRKEDKGKGYCGLGAVKVSKKECESGFMMAINKCDPRTTNKRGGSWIK